ncbi:MAG: glycosyltransferase [Thermoflexales bacterium]|nr:glycosyltransferase [Thermoflexales bacterium]MCS7325271.1 glycosyltransferase [Thermoflexales bacterium]MCX7939862.1 glycosyltransferase [Thermoflexales bacterium]MDW8053560.1 glycosyltransferase [Anaerolineae bacterium]MDW8292144.1 glycosyltransferase [Anaerolineae bacterium]
MLREAVSVIVPTRNEAHNIVRFLSSIPHDVPVIVVDASDDETPALVAQMRPDAHVIRQPSTVTEARQIGAAHARTRWLLFTDADVSFADDYFDHLARFRPSPSLGLIFGPKDTRDAYRAYHRWFEIGQRLFARLGIPAASGSNLIIRRDAFEHVGGFDLTLTCNEDSEIAWRIKRAGYAAHFAPELRVFSHDHRRLRRGVIRKVMHSSLRCTLLYFNVMPRRWRQRDWGYWSR